MLEYVMSWNMYRMHFIYDSVKVKQILLQSLVTVIVLIIIIFNLIYFLMRWQEI